MKQYLDLVRDIMENGSDREDRTGVGRRSVFGRQLRFDLDEGFPLLTAKATHWKSVVGELLWFLEGGTNAHVLRDKYGVTIWDEWADRLGMLGPIYGYQWRSWPNLDNGYYTHDSVDQIRQVIEEIKVNPTSSRLLVSAWNVSDLDDMALPPCHVMFQFYVNDGKLSCLMYQRSADVFLGVPFNIASYALLTHMVAHVIGLGVGDLVISFGDAHLYQNHIAQAHEMTTRVERDEWLPPLPSLILDPEVTDIDDFTPESIHLLGYNPLPAIKAPVAI